MRRMARLVGLAAVLVGAFHFPGALARPSAPDATAPRAEHVILISVDGLRPEFYLEERWPAPMIRRMAREGVHARAVRSVAPTSTYPAHTTMVTGALPARHGIRHNRPFEPEGVSGRWKVEAERIRVPTLWDAVREARGTSAGISWPVTVGAPIDWNVPEFWSVTGREGDLTGPAAHTAALRTRVTPPGLLEELEAEAIGPFPDFYWGRNRSREDAVGAMAGHLIERYRPTLLLVHLTQTDWHQHAHGREHPEVELALAAVDRAVARMVEAAERAGILERTAFVVTGDHGFTDVDTRILPNVWLVDAGLHEDRSDRGDWRAAFHTAGGSAFLRLRDPDDADAVEEVRAVVEGLPSEVRSLVRVVERDELDALGADPESPLALDGAPGVVFTRETQGPAVREGTGGTHGHLPDLPEMQTGFVAWGAGVADGGVVERMELADVAPVVATLLGIPFEAPDGALPAGIVRER